MKFTLRLITGFLLTVIFAVQIGHAQDAVKYDDTILRSLFERQLQSPEDEYVQKRIEDERTAIKEIIEDELLKTIAPPEDEQNLDASELLKALDKQRNVIIALNDRLRERRVDLDLLKAEETRYYKVDVTIGTGGIANDKFRLTKSYPELLSKKAALEERIKVLESLLILQQSRLQSLTIGQRLQQFELIIDIGFYLLIIILVILLEKLVRNVLLRRIKDTDMRYTATKIFSSSAYVLLTLWLLGVIFSRNPSLLASFAIIGAGLAIALQDIVKDVLGWFIIMQNRLFSKGQRITIGSITGEVIDTGLIRTTLLEIGNPADGNSSVLERTGKAMSIPNSMVLTQQLTNHNTTSDYVKAEMKFAITFESDWRKGREILEKIVEEISGEYYEREKRQSHRTRMYYIPHKTSGNQVYMNIAADGVEYTLRFTIPVGERRPVTTKITDLVMERFNAEPTVDLAYTTQRILAEMIK